MKELITIGLIVGCGYVALASDCIQPSSCDVFKYGELANDVYQPQATFPMRCGDYSIPTVCAFGNGLYAHLVKQDGEYVVAFRGTQEEQDFKDDLDQALYGDNVQFSEAIDYVDKISKMLSVCDPSALRKVVGHSLGGALAQYVAQNRPSYTAITFNPAGLLPDELICRETPCVYNFVHKDDILATLVNPLLKEMGKVDPKIASGYIGEDVDVGRDFPVCAMPKYDFSKAKLTREDVKQLRDVAPYIAEFLKASQLGKLLNAGPMVKLLSEVDCIRRVFECIDTDIAAAWDQLCEHYKKKPVESGLGTGIYDAVKPWIDDKEALERFASVMQKHLGSAIGAHSLGKEVPKFNVTTPVVIDSLPQTDRDYTPGSMLAILKAKCDEERYGKPITIRKMDERPPRHIMPIDFDSMLPSPVAKTNTPVIIDGSQPVEGGGNRR